MNFISIAIETLQSKLLFLLYLDSLFLSLLLIKFISFKLLWQPKNDVNRFRRRDMRRKLKHEKSSNVTRWNIFLMYWKKKKIVKLFMSADKHKQQQLMVRCLSIVWAGAGSEETTKLILDERKAQFSLASWFHAKSRRQLYTFINMFDVYSS